MPSARIHPQNTDSSSGKEDVKQQVVDNIPGLVAPQGADADEDEVKALAEAAAKENTSEEHVNEAMLRKGILRRPRQSLHEAIHRGQLEVVEQICKERCGTALIDEFSAMGSSGWNETPLMVACQAYHLPLHHQLLMIGHLLTAGARTDQLDKKGRSAIALSIMSSPDRTTKLVEGIPEWYSKGDKVLCRINGKWKNAIVLGYGDTTLDSGGMVVYTVRTLGNDKKVFHGIHKQDLCQDTIPRKGSIRLGMSAVFRCKEDNTNSAFQSGVICNVNPRGGYDVHSGDAIIPMPDSRIRLPIQQTSSYTPATEGRLYPGCPVAVLLPGWRRFEKGRIEGRNNIHGGFNILLNEKINIETGERAGETYKWLGALVGNNTSRRFRSLEKLIESDKCRGTYGGKSQFIDSSSQGQHKDATRFLVGVQLERIMLIQQATGISKSCEAVVQMLCTERRRNECGEYVTQSIDRYSWPKYEKLNQISQLSGSQVIALAARHSNLAVLQKLEEHNLIQSKQDLYDWVDGKETLELVQCPDMAIFLMQYGLIVSLSYATKYAAYGNKRESWKRVMNGLLNGPWSSQPIFWSETSPVQSGLNSIQWTCKAGASELLEMLLARPEGAAIAAHPSKPGNHPLYLVIRSWAMPEVKMSMVKTLINSDVSIQNSKALFAAVDCNLLDLVQLLLENGADPQEKMEGTPPQYRAASYVAVERLAEYTNNGVDMLAVSIVEKCLQHPENSNEWNGWVELLKQVNGDLTGLQAWNESGETALSLAVCHQKASLVRVLVEKKMCNPNVRTAKGEYPIGLAAFLNTDSTIINILIRNSGYDVVAKGTLAFPRACKRKHIDILNTLLEAHETSSLKMDLEEPLDGLTPIEWLLTDAVGNINKTTRDMIMRLAKLKVSVQPSLISELGWLDVLTEVLTQRNGEKLPPVPTPGKTSAMMHAIARGDVDMVKFLVSCGADLLQTNTLGQSVLVMALESPVNEYLDLSEPRQAKIRYHMLEALLAGEHAQTLIQASGVLAAAATRNCLASIDLLNTKSPNRKWCEEDEVDVSQVTNERLSPVELATDQRVQWKLIEENGFAPNIANLAREGKFGLVLHCLKEQNKRGLSKATWTALCCRRSTCAAVDRHYEGHTGRTALGWIIPKSYSAFTTDKYKNLKTGIASFYYAQPSHFQKWGHETLKKGWVKGTAFPVTGYDDSRYTPNTKDFSGLVEWVPQGAEKKDVLILPLHALLFADNTIGYERGKSVLVTHKSSTPPYARHMTTYQKVYLVDNVKESFDGDEWFATKERIQTTGTHYPMKNPFKVKLKDCIVYVKLSDMTNENATTILIDMILQHGDGKLQRHFLDDEGKSVLELACRGGDINLIESIMKLRTEFGFAKDPTGGSDYRHPCCAAICAAAAGRRFSVLKMLLSMGIPPDSYKDGRSAGKWAASECCMRLLREAWKPGQTSDALYDLCMMSRRGWTVEVQKLLAHPFNANPNIESETGRTPLMEAASGGHIKLFKILLEVAEVTKFDHHGRSVLTTLVGLHDQDLGYEMSLWLLESRNAVLKGDKPKKEFIKRSKALTQAVSQPNPHILTVQLLLRNGSNSNEMSVGKSALRHISPTGTATKLDVDGCVESKISVALLILRELLTWEVRLLDPKSRFHGIKGIVQDTSIGQDRYKVRFKDESSLVEVTEWVRSDATESIKIGPASCGKMNHLDFIHAVSMGWPAVVGLLVDLGAIEGYHTRSLPYICQDTLKEALLQCLAVLGPIWVKSDGLTTPSEWYILRHLLRGLDRAHSNSTVGPTLQQAVNELLTDEIDTLGLLPLSLYKEAVEQNDKTFFSPLFSRHRHKLIVSVCEGYRDSISHDALVLEPISGLYGNSGFFFNACDALKVFKSLYIPGREDEAGNSTLELAVEVGWVEAVDWLLNVKGVDANDTNTANLPIKTISIEVDKRRHEIIADNLDYFFRKTLSGSSYVDLMRERDAGGSAFACESLNNAVITQSRDDIRMRNYIEIVMLLFSSGSNADPEDLDRLSYLMRLDTKFNLTQSGVVYERASLLHIAAACENEASCRWLLSNTSYSDTVGSGVLEDKKGRTARHYTASHNCHTVLAAAEQEAHITSGYMPPLDQISLVLALEIGKVLDFDLSNIMRGACGKKKANNTIGVSTVLHALNKLDLAGFVVECERGGQNRKGIPQEEEEEVLDELLSQQQQAQNNQSARRISAALAAQQSQQLNKETVEANSKPIEKDVYVVVSGSEKRQSLTCTRQPFLRCGNPGEPLLSKEKHSVTASIVSSFTWPVLDLKIQTAQDHIINAVKAHEEENKIRIKKESPSKVAIPDDESGNEHQIQNPFPFNNEIASWVRSGEWLNYGHCVMYPVSLRILCDDVIFQGEYSIPTDIDPQGSPLWIQSQLGSSTSILREDKQGRWAIYSNIYSQKPKIRACLPHRGFPPTHKFKWLRYVSRGKEGCWRPVQVTIIEDMKSGTYNRWETVNKCRDLVFSLLSDASPEKGRPVGHVARRIEKIITDLPDGTPQVVKIHASANASAFKELDGKYIRNAECSNYLNWSWVKKDNPTIQLKATFSRTFGTAEETLGRTSEDADIISRWSICKTTPSEGLKCYLEMRSPDIAPWYESGRWMNVASKTQTPEILFTSDSILSRKQSFTILERKTSAMWGLRQLLLAAGTPIEDLPFRDTGRLEQDAPSVYEPPDFIRTGHLPPGQKWLDLLVEECKVAQVFGVHDEVEASQVLDEWAPSASVRGLNVIKKFWLCQPFAGLSEYLFEMAENITEKKCDPVTMTICDRKTFLSLEPRERHTSSEWNTLPTLHTAAIETPLFHERTVTYFNKNRKKEPIPTPDATLEPGGEIQVHGNLKEWASVSKPDDKWWLPVFDCEGQTILKNLGDGEGGPCHYRSTTAAYYHRDTKSKKIKDTTVEPLRRGRDIEVLYLSLEGKWARVRHHAKAIHFARYWMPLVAADSTTKTLKPGKVSPLCKLESYLGSKIAFYFAFTACYCSYLILLLFTGMCFTVVQIVLGLYNSEKVTMWNAVVILLWASLFRQRWMRKASELAFMWNVRNVEQWEPPMAEFLKRNIKVSKKPHPITGLSEPNFTPADRRHRFAISGFVTATMAASVILVMYFNVKLRDTFGRTDTGIKLALGVENAVSVAIMDALFAVIADNLNSMENHRTKSSLQNSAIIKNFVFRFINGFSGLMITVLQTASGICECPSHCNTACMTKQVLPADPLWLICPSEEYIEECVSSHKQRDLIIQLTTQLVIQSVLSVTFEKLLPKLVLNQRQEEKIRHNQKNDIFPQVLGSIKVSSFKAGNYLSLFETEKGLGYRIETAADGPWSKLRKCSTQYGGIWKVEGDVVEYEATQTDDSITFKCDEVVLGSFPIPNPHDTVDTDAKTSQWIKITSNSYEQLTVVTQSKGKPQGTLIIKRTREFREGFVSPMSKLTLSTEDRSNAMIPTTAANFVWVYGISDPLSIMVGGRPQSLISQIDTFDNGSDEKGAMQMVLFGAYAYLAEDGRTIVAANSVGFPEKGEKGNLAFSGHRTWNDRYTKALWQAGRFQPVMLSDMLKAGARWYSWIPPYEELTSDTVGDPLWMASKSGCFVYLFESQDTERTTTVGANPPPPHHMNRFFPVRSRQKDSKLIIIMETMKPPTTEEKEFNDYTMMMLQFSYVVCFAPVLPLAPLVALFTGCIELHTDLFKFLRLAQRPEAQKASGIGAWLTLLTAIVYIAVPINTTIILTGYGYDEYRGNYAKELIYMACMIIGFFLVSVVRLLPTTATWVAECELRQDYEALQT